VSALCDRTVPVLGLLSCRWSETRTCWFPHPDEQPVKSSLRLLILTQAAVWLCVAGRAPAPRRILSHVSEPVVVE
jgi:hypothetical protein